MKKIFYLITAIIVIIHINACTGYTPIFVSSNLNFEIARYSIEGNKRLGNQIYYKLQNLSKKDPAAKSIGILIGIKKNKEATAKNSAGKILEYKITLNTNVIINDYLSDKLILNKNFTYFSSYKVQDQHSETVKTENTIIENLLNQTYQSLLIQMSESMLAS